MTSLSIMASEAPIIPKPQWQHLWPTNCGHAHGGQQARQQQGVGAQHAHAPAARGVPAKIATSMRSTRRCVPTIKLRLALPARSSKIGWLRLQPDLSPFFLSAWMNPCFGGRYRACHHRLPPPPATASVGSYSLRVSHGASIVVFATCALLTYEFPTASKSCYALLLLS
jgi:hypothetical protein